MLVWMMSMAMMLGNGGEALQAQGVGAQGVGAQGVGKVPPRMRTPVVAPNGAVVMKPTAQGRLMARRAAHVTAMRNAGRGYDSADGKIRHGRLDWRGRVRGYRVSDTTLQSDGSVRVIVTRD